MYFNKNDKSPISTSNEIKLYSQGNSHVSVFAVFTRHALRNKRL